MNESPLTAEVLAAALAAHATAPPRLALTRAEAARALGVSTDFFSEHVQPHVKVIRRGRLVLVPTAELERWVAESAERTLPKP